MSRTAVVGRVLRVRRRAHDTWRVRLTDTGGGLAAAEIMRSLGFELPRVGAQIVVYGRIRYDEQHRWYTVDPVDAWHETKS